MRRLRSGIIFLIAAILAIPVFAGGDKTSTTATAKKKKTTSGSEMPPVVEKAFSMIREEPIRADVKYLSDDLFEGRGPGTRGDALTTKFIAARFEALGLHPEGDNGTYFQKVSLVGVETDETKTSLSFAKDGGPSIGPLKYRDEFVGTDQTQSETGVLGSEMIFVGHGVEAPEYQWNDYKGIDPRGKTLVMLVDDPPATSEEPDLFKGKARTYYGRWTYKFEIGAAKGAQAVILIHTDEAAGYGWQVVRNSWGRERSYLAVREGEPELRFAGWITKPVAANLFKAAGHDLDAMIAAAHRRDFKPVPLGHRFTGNIAIKMRTFDTQNVVASLKGSDPQLSRESVLYTGHHDHLGIGTPDATGDAIYNGAVDNASGIAVLLELARVWAASPRPKRSVHFAAVAAEEQGLLGSAFYGENPPVPAGRIAVNLNFDAIQMFGRVRGIYMNGIERTTFLPTAQRVTKGMGIAIVPDPAPEQGYYYRSDHFSLGKIGIPAFSVDQSDEVVGKPAEFGKMKDDEYREKYYHQPADEVRADWDWSSGVQMAQLGFWLGYEAAQAPTAPNWLPGDEFRAIRDKSLAAAK